ncbi:hypothetical protein [Spongiactinospora rosea]|uniref:hypothetical protein n=1 Tax=Spongiactinospora rosea TaxID=2248750 RepID=UPI0018F44CF1|nr:hypothetical protein [Spongiactinospora rosea]
MAEFTMETTLIEPVDVLGDGVGLFEAFGIADADFRIALARRSSFTSRSSSAIRLIAPSRVAGSLPASTGRPRRTLAEFIGYFREAAMNRNLPGPRCLHQTRGGSVFALGQVT